LKIKEFLITDPDHIRKFVKLQNILETPETPVRIPCEMKRPIAYQSPLWPHLEQIRTWRRARLTWREIKERLEPAPYSINLTIQAIHSFFVTASKRKEPPLGFDSLPGHPPRSTPPAQSPSPETNAEQEQIEGDISDQALDAYLAKQKENKPKQPDFSIKKPIDL
jgi:hypothetical protein